MICAVRFLSVKIFKMNEINPEDILDTKIVNNTTYNLMLCSENGVKMKLWIPEYFVSNARNLKSDITNRSTDIPEKPILTIDYKVNQIYQQLSKATDEDLLSVQKQVSDFMSFSYIYVLHLCVKSRRLIPFCLQVVRLSLKELSPSLKSEIRAMIVKFIYSYQTARKISPIFVKKLRLSILQEEITNKRREQLSMLFCLEEEINLVSKSSKKISVINFQDLEILPFDFSYINSNIAGDDVSFSKNPPIGCDCIGRRICLLNNCCPEMFNSRATYNEAGEVMVCDLSFNYLIYYPLRLLR